MPHFNERHFIERTQHGNTEAFTPLVTTYQPRLYTHILGRIKDTETAKDLTQETWMKAFRAINTFRADASFYSWLYRIATNLWTSSAAVRPFGDHYGQAGHSASLWGSLQMFHISLEEENYALSQK
ncbi:MAG: hypothetical protein OXU27_13100 [Candidatus Poribacteria bacterium]|nr:hypothetical protein [Candidatus Poribacteria bacterium]MDE0325496.1 hypothetical protein [Candidatus Poribacteria bacterium]